MSNFIHRTTGQGESYNISNDGSESLGEKAKIDGVKNSFRPGNHAKLSETSRSQGSYYSQSQDIRPTNEKRLSHFEPAPHPIERATLTAESTALHSDMGTAQSSRPWRAMQLEISPSLTATPESRRKKALKPPWPWTDELVELMLKTLLEQKNLGRQTGGTWNAIAWAACGSAINGAMSDPTVRPCDQEVISSKWQTLKKPWPAYCQHYGFGCEGHCSGWQPNYTTRNSISYKYSGIEPGVLVSSKEVMAAHYAHHKECVPFKKKHPKHIELLKLLLGDRPIEARNFMPMGAQQNNPVSPSIQISPVSPSMSQTSPSSPIPLMVREAKNDLGNNIIRNLISSEVVAEAITFNHLATALSKPRPPAETNATLAMKKAQNLEGLNINDETLWNLNELFFENERKAEQFLSLPERLIERWIAKEFGDQMYVE